MPSMSETSSGTVYNPSSILDGREHRRNDRSFSKVIASVGADTVIIPGHGKPLSTLDDLKHYHEMLATIRDNVARLKSAGRSVEETVAANLREAFDDQWAKAIISPAFFTRFV